MYEISRRKTPFEKTSLDQNVLKNFRPVSNLPFVSKLIENLSLINFSVISTTTIFGTPSIQLIAQNTVQRQLSFVSKMTS